MTLNKYVKMAAIVAGVTTAATSASLAQDSSSSIFTVTGGFTHNSVISKFTFGADYEYLVSDKFSIGAVYDYMSSGNGRSVYLVTANIRTIENVRLTAGFGQEKFHNVGLKADELFRVGASYEFKMDNGMIFAPTVSADFVGGRKFLNTGIRLGKAF